MDLTRLMAEESGLGVDEKEFLKEQEKARELSRSARSSGENGGENVVMDVHDIAKIERMESIPATDDQHKYCRYTPIVF